MDKPSKNKPKKGTDIFSKEKRSLIMGAIKGKDTSLETKFAERLKSAGLKFERNVERLPGRPDIVFRRSELVIFLDGCFWHGCKTHFKAPKSNNFFWNDKIQNNINRDKKVNRFYKTVDWKVMRFWGHEIKKNPDKSINKIKIYLSEYKLHHLHPKTKNLKK